MSVRQYIGARYVTKIYENTLDPSSAEWQASVNYEPLTMVTYNNGSYLSKKQVPASIGDPASNPAYWAQTGFYNGQISYLQSEIDTINDKIIPLHRRYLFVGDSYSLMNVGWLNKLVNLMGLSASDYYTACVSGSAFTSQTDSTKWINMVTSVISGMSDDEKKTVTDVVCVGGINDALPYSTYPDCSNDDDAILYTVACINDFADYIASTLPNAIVSLFFVGNTEEGMDPDGQRYYHNIVRTLVAWENASRPNLTIFKGSETLLHEYSLMAADGIHPNENGCIMISRFVNNCLNGGSGIDIVNGYKTGLSIGTTAGGDASVISMYGTLSYTTINGSVNLTSNGPIIFEMDNATSYSDGDTLILGQFSDRNIIHGKNIEIPCTAHYIVSASTSAEMVCAHLIIDKGILKLKIGKLNNNWGAVQSTTFMNIIIELPNILYPMIQN